MKNQNENRQLLAGIPLFPLRYGAVLPGDSLQIPVGRPQTIRRLANLKRDDEIVIATQFDASVDRPELVDLVSIGTLARFKKVIRANGHHIVELEPIARFEIESVEWADDDARIFGRQFEEAEDEESIETVALLDALFERLQETARFAAPFLRSLRSHSGSSVADRVARELSLETDARLELLAATSAAERLELVHQFLTDVETYEDVRKDLDKSIRDDARNAQREAMLRHQLKAIQNELGDSDDDRKETLREKLEALQLPDEVREVVDRELRKLESTPEGQAEYGVTYRYLEVISELPWSDRAEETINIPEIERRLDEDHYGLDEVKDRILEHLAVLDAVGTSDATVLCLVGPPGVGKTSIATSIADALDRPFIRIALGGVRDEAEIRGHRRTYIGALPGRIVNGFRKSKVKNPVVLLDELDKLGKGWSGDPEAALLEVLDPEQNSTFTDHYLEVPFDLSEAIFIGTANTLDTLSAPLRDRLEVITLHGYTEDEKGEIARRHLIPSASAKHDIGALDVTDDALETIIDGYTRESGVRQLDRQIGKLFRALTLKKARGKLEKAVVATDDVSELLGRRRFMPRERESVFMPGLAAGLAWTPVGGDVLYVEATRMPGKGTVITTGQLGDVMKESARAAMSYVRSHSEELEIDPSFLELSDVHVHFPAGAVPKDGPSAGVTVFTALTSLLTGRAVRADTAMTGECSLRGRVLPVGGIKTKVIAAHRLGMKRIILPAQNEPDLDDLPETVRNELDIVLATTMEDVLEAALEPIEKSSAMVIDRAPAPVNM